MMRWTLEAMGFSVQIMPLPEVYLAIQQGAVAGQENPIDTIYSNKFYEVAPNVTLTNHVYSPIPLAIRRRPGRSCRRPTRSRRDQGGKGGGQWSRKEIRGNDERQLKEMAAKGAKIARPDIGPSAPRCSRSTPRPRRSTAPTSMA
jgi:TRAP-type C4-dicarboxylate transport system substrate-binding protein